MHRCDLRRGTARRAPTSIDNSERATQNRVIALFREEPGYHYLGDWTDHPHNSNMETGLLSTFLSRNYSPPSRSVAPWTGSAPKPIIPTGASTTITRGSTACSGTACRCRAAAINSRFKGLMDQFLPQWRVYREELNRMPLGHDEWEC